MADFFKAFRYGGNSGGGPDVGSPPATDGAKAPSSSPSVQPRSPGNATALGTALSWITAALRPYSNQPPNALAQAPIQPSLDVLNAGWALATYASGAVAFAAGTLSSIWNIISKSASANFAAFTNGDTVPFPQTRGGFIAKLLAMDAVHLAGAAPGTINFFLVPSPALFGASPAVEIASASVANGGGVATNAALFNTNPVIVPPGWDIEIQFPTTAGGESWVVHYAFACLPLGSQP